MLEIIAQIREFVNTSFAKNKETMRMKRISMQDVMKEIRVEKPQFGTNHFYCILNICRLEAKTVRKR